MGNDSPSVFDRQTCQKLRFVPDETERGQRILVDETTDPADWSYIVYLSGCDELPVRVSRGELDSRIEVLFSSGDQPTPTVTPSNRKLSDAVADGKVVSLLDQIIREAIDEKASDIHFEPADQWLACRIRIDGLLVHKQTIGQELIPEVVSRLKIMAGLDIAEKRRPQDGRIRIPHADRTVDIRVSVIPTDFGEKVVLRILDKATLRLDLETLGLSPNELLVLREKISLANGIILVTGPTGSGKTTTLYAALNHLKSPHVNISTIEDPIEYNLGGINQTQVKPEINLTFASMLRALLRQDPNVIMVGEIRDRETLDIAIQASLTGHLVLSTIHTNNAVATVSRLVDMGAEPFLLASSLRLIVAQRLLRLNCPKCQSRSLSEANRAAALKLGLSVSEYGRECSGCEYCHNTGFAGRTAIYELLTIDESIKTAIVHGCAESEIAGTARQQGYKTMIESAQSLIDSGRTTPMEVLREINS